MKKLISLLLAVLLAVLCAGGIAEGTEATEETAFVQIREGVTAQVFAKPGDEKAIDSIPGGQVCGLIDETTEAGATWFQVFYLNSMKKGATGYINAEDAKKLSADELKALMEDTTTLNEILDLIDALNDYLGTGSTGTTGGNRTNTETNGGGTEEESTGFKALYDKAMKALEALFSMNLSTGTNTGSTTGIAGKALDTAKDVAGKALDTAKDIAGKAADTAKNIAGKASDTAKDVADKATDAAKNIADKAPDIAKDIADKASEAGTDIAKKAAEGISDAAKAMKDGVTKEDIQDLIDSINKTLGLEENKIDLDDKLDQMQKTLDSINENLGNKTGKALDSVDDAMENTRKWIDGDKFTKIRNAVKDLSIKFKENGFWKGAGSTGNFFNSIKDAIGGGKK